MSHANIDVWFERLPRDLDHKRNTVEKIGALFFDLDISEVYKELVTLSDGFHYALQVASHNTIATTKSSPTAFAGVPPPQKYHHIASPCPQGDQE